MMEIQTRSEFNRDCDIIRDTLSELSREANHAAWLAGHLKVARGEDGEETFGALCYAQAMIADKKARLDAAVGKMIYPPQPDEGKEQVE